MEFHQLIKSVSYEMNGVVIHKSTAKGEAIIEHENIDEKDCLVCQLFKKHYSGHEMQYWYGTLHQYNKEKKEYYCYRGALRVENLSEDDIDFMKELTPA